MVIVLYKGYDMSYLLLGCIFHVIFFLIFLHEFMTGSQNDYFKIHTEW